MLLVTDDSNSSSDDDEPLTPTSSATDISFPELNFLNKPPSAVLHSDTSELDLTSMTTKDHAYVSTCQTDFDRLNYMKPIQTQSNSYIILPQPPTTRKVAPIDSPQRVADQLSKEKTKHCKKNSWITTLFKPKKNITSLFSKKSLPPLTKHLLPVAESTKKPQQPTTYTRYPFDIERSIYRLSHEKLANAHRPLQQQVVISNMMYWYLKVLRASRPYLMNCKRSSTQNINHYYNTSICQATYQSFAPPTPGTQYKHQPISHKHTTYQQPITVSSKTKKNSKYKPIENTAFFTFYNI